VDDALHIRPATDDDLPAIVRTLGQERYFARCLARARVGAGVLLVAWYHDDPVGDVYLRLEPADEPELLTWLPGVPLLNHLEVRGDRRNRQIGSALVRTAGELLSGRGHDRVALGVDPRNEDAIRLYKRLGFQPWPYDDVWTTRLTYLPDGRQSATQELCKILVKDLQRR